MWEDTFVVVMMLVVIALVFSLRKKKSPRKRTRRRWLHNGFLYGAYRESIRRNKK